MEISSLTILISALVFAVIIYLTYKLSVLKTNLKWQSQLSRLRREIAEKQRVGIKGRVSETFAQIREAGRELEQLCGVHACHDRDVRLATRNIKRTRPGAPAARWSLPVRPPRVRLSRRVHHARRRRLQSLSPRARRRAF